MRSFLKTLAILTGAAIFGISVALITSHAQTVTYWSVPSANAPANNAYGLLNASTFNQSKLGGLSLGNHLIVQGASNLTGPTNAYFPFVSLATPPALTVNGGIRIQDGTQAPGKLFIASNNSGLGSWVSLNCGTNSSGQQLFLAGINSNGTPNCVLPSGGGTTPPPPPPTGPQVHCSISNRGVATGGSNVAVVTCPTFTATRNGSVNISASSAFLAGGCTSGGNVASLQLRGTSAFIPAGTGSVSGTSQVVAQSSYTYSVEVRASQCTYPTGGGFNNFSVSMNAQQP